MRSQLRKISDKQNINQHRVSPTSFRVRVINTSISSISSSVERASIDHNTRCAWEHDIAGLGLPDISGFLSM